MPSEVATQKILVLGIGNLLWADEGFGVRCVENLAANFDFSPAITLMDGGTQGLYLLPEVQAADCLLIFDALDYPDTPAGSLREIEGDDVPRFMGIKKMSLHQTGFQEVLMAAALTEKLPKVLHLIGVQAAELDDYGGSLSRVVKAKIPEAILLGLQCLNRWGVVATPRNSLLTANKPAPLLHPALALSDYEENRPNANTACRVGDARFLGKESPCA